MKKPNLGSLRNLMKTNPAKVSSILEKRLQPHDAEDRREMKAGTFNATEEASEDSMKKKTPPMKPKGKKGMAQVKKLGRTYKTGGFAKIANKAAKKYGSAAAGKKVAGAIYQRMVRARG